MGILANKDEAHTLITFVWFDLIVRILNNDYHYNKYDNDRNKDDKYD